MRLPLHQRFYFLAILLGITTASPFPSPSSKAARDGITFYNDRTIFQSPATYTAPGTLYARTIQLADHSLLATWENYSPEPPLVAFPIYHSTDLGQSWSFLSWVNDTEYSYGLRYQPFIYLLPRAFAGWETGTIFLAGSAIPTDLSSTHLELYVSTDDGATWKFVSHIAAGGKAVPNNGETPVWEPSLMLYYDESKGKEVLVCYYSDQRDAKHGQKLVHQFTSDGLSWEGVVDDVAYDEYTARPGMPIVAQLGEGGKYLMTYEYGGGPVDGAQPADYTFPVFYKIAANPLQFDAVEGLPIVTNDAARTVPVSSPYVVYDGPEAMLIVSCGTLGDVFVNKDMGAVGSWEAKKTNERTSYSRSLNLVSCTEGAKGLLLADGGSLPPSKENKVTVGLVDIEGW
jgi:hypothetical protein